MEESPVIVSNLEFFQHNFFLVENVEGKRKEYGDSLNCEICLFHFSEELISWEISYSIMIMS